MTREEAIDDLKDLVKYDDYGSLHSEAIDMAIEALKAEPCDNCVNREAVLEINESHHGQMPNYINHQIWEEIKALPPVTPAREQGEWNLVSLNDMALKIYRCSICDNKTYGSTNFCPNCGADMRGEQNEMGEE